VEKVELSTPSFVAVEIRRFVFPVTNRCHPTTSGDEEFVSTTTPPVGELLDPSGSFHRPAVAESANSDGSLKMLDRSNRSAVEEVQIDGELCAIIISAQHDDLGIQFFTPNEYSQQIASMSYPSGKVIPAHTHNPVRREVFYTQEALFIRKGRLRVDFYSQEQEYRTSRVLGAGDVVLLIRGGHGFEVLEDLNMVEVKQGPYAGDMDKTRFSAVLPSNLKFD
jgi:mannose-6-phosphate isomerase-like protein (cupin superfamily)